MPLLFAAAALCALVAGILPHLSIFKARIGSQS